MRTHFINSVTSKEHTGIDLHNFTHEHTHFCRTHTKITHMHRVERPCPWDREGLRNDEALEERTRQMEKGVLARPGREIPHKFEFPHSQCVCTFELWKSRQAQVTIKTGKESRTQRDEEKSQILGALQLLLFTDFVKDERGSFLRQNWLTDWQALYKMIGETSTGGSHFLSPFFNFYFLHRWISLIQWS